MIRLYSAVATVIAVAAAHPAAAQDPVASRPARKLPPPAQFQKLADCRAIVDDSRRLACLDREVAALVAAEGRSELVVLDRGQLRSTRRSLFGLSLPRLPFLDDDSQAPPDRVEGVVRAVAVARDGKWSLTLADAVWRTTEVAETQALPKAGDPVLVRRGALGAFLLSVNGRRALRAVRVR